MASIQIEFYMQDNQTGTIYDASELLISATWSGRLAGQPGKLAFDIVRDGTLAFYEGSRCALTVEGFRLFYGWVFSKSRKDSLTTSVVAYDQKRYLKNADAKVFTGGTASERFSQLCEEFELAYQVVHPSSFVLPLRSFDNNTLADMIEDGIDKTLIHSGEWYMVRDNFGTLEFLDIAKLKTNLILGDASLMTGYDYQTSIDDDTYNRIKLMQENKETAKRDVYMVYDQSTIDRWGLLQHVETVDENANAAQIEARAGQLLRQKNRVTRKLSLDALGDFRIMPGNGVWVETGLDDMKLSRYMIAHEVSHTIKNKLHTMKVNLEVVE